MTTSRTLENIPVRGDDASGFFLQETKKGFCAVGSWKARIIRWLHLEGVFGKVYCIDKSGLNALERRVENAARKCQENAAALPSDECFAIVSLAKCLHLIKVQKNNHLLHAVSQSVDDVAGMLFFNYIKRPDRQQAKEWYSFYGMLAANQFIEECSKKERKSWRAVCEKKCRSLRDEFPAFEKEILSAFFSQVKETSYSQALKSVEAAYRRRWRTTDLFKSVEEAAQAFCVTHESAPSLTMALSLKKSLKDLADQAPQKASILSCRFIGLIRQSLLPWRFKEALRDYGKLVGEECKKPLEKSFEQACEFVRKLFSVDKDFASVVEGMIESKGKKYCRAVAKAIQPDQFGGFLKAYVERASLLFSTSAQELVKGVFKEILQEQKDHPSDSLWDALACIFVRMYKEKNAPEDFSVFTPILGNGISAQKTSPAIESSDQKEESLWPEALRGIELNVMDQEGLLKIEQKIVSMMIQEQNVTAFCAYYGDILGRRIVERARACKDEPYGECIKKGRLIYEGFISTHFPAQKQLILGPMNKVLEIDPLAKLDVLVSSPSSWKEVGAFDAIVANLRRQSIDFCPALERVSSNIVNRLIAICQEVKDRHPVSPPLNFFYSVAPSLYQSIQAVIHALGLQGNGEQYFIALLKKHPEAQSIVQWIEKANKYKQEPYKITFTISTKVPERPSQGCEREVERELMMLPWVACFLDPQAVHDSLFRSGSSSVAVDEKLVEKALACTTDMAKCCAVAEALYQKVPQQIAAQKGERYKKAIGTLMTFAAIEYDPGSLIPSILQTFPKSLGISSDVVFLGGDAHHRSPVSEKFVFRFGYKDGKFNVERDIRYRALNIKTGEELGWWNIKSRQEIDPLRVGEISVTFTSEKIPPKGV